MSVNLPASISAGDLLVALVEVRNTGTWTLPSGWVQLGQQLGGSSVGQLTAFYKIADGTEGATVTWTASVGTSAIWQVRKISSWHGTTPPEMTSSQGDFTTQPNSPSLTPSWGAEDNLWFAITGNAATANLTTGAPTSYTGYQQNTGSSGGAQVNIASAYRELNAATEDPGVFTNPGSIRYWAAMTVAVRPSGAASPTPIEISQGSYTTTGQAVGLRITRKITTASGSLTYTGQVTALGRSFLVVAESGSFTLTGHAVEPRRKYTILVARGNLDLTGQTTNFFRVLVISSEAGSFTISGQPTQVLVSYRVLTDSGTYNLSGQTTSLRRATLISIQSGSYVLSGQEAIPEIVTPKILTPNSGSYSTTGQAVGLTANICISYLLQEDGDFLLQENGFKIVLEQCIIPPNILTAEFGSYTLTGQTTNLRARRNTTAEFGNYTLTGQAVSLRKVYKITCQAGSYTKTGQATGVLYNRYVFAVRGEYQLTGQVTNLIKLSKLSLDAGSYTTTGFGTGLRYIRRYQITASQGSILLTGVKVLFIYSAEVGNIKVWTGLRWSKRQMKVWDGATHNNALLKRWNGTTWETIDYS